RCLLPLALHDALPIFVQLGRADIEGRSDLLHRQLVLVVKPLSELELGRGEHMRAAATLPGRAGCKCLARALGDEVGLECGDGTEDRKSTRLNSSHVSI